LHHAERQRGAGIGVTAATGTDEGIELGREVGRGGGGLAGPKAERQQQEEAGTHGENGWRFSEKEQNHLGRYQRMFRQIPAKAG